MKKVPTASKSSNAPGAELMLLAMIAVTPALFAVGIPRGAALTDTCLHVLQLCLATLARFDFMLHALPLALLAAGLANAAMRSGRAVREAGNIMASLRAVPPPVGGVLHDLAHRHGLTDAIRIIPDVASFAAFTAGLWHPRILIGAGVLNVLSRAELEAVVLHERRHWQRRDPLRFLLARGLADTLFWIPLLRDVMAAVKAKIEFTADDAARSVGDAVLASAILKLADPSRRPAVAIAGIADRHLIQRRVERLLGGQGTEGKRSSTLRSVLLSSAAMATIWMLALASTGAHAAHLAPSHSHCPHHHHMVVFHQN